MKKLTHFIKGFLIASLFIGAFTMNTNIQLNNRLSQEAAQVQSVSVSNHWTPQAYAQAANPKAANQPKAAAKIPDELITTINKASSLINKLFNPLIYFFTRHIGNFLTNDYIYGGNMGAMLQQLWVISRNIVNIIFVLILLFLAVRYIFGSDEGSDLKKILPMFVLMLVAVNFSWLGARLVLDAANVATNVAFSIPSGVNPTKVINLPDCVADTTAGSNKVKGACGVKEIWFPFDSVSHSDLTMADCQKYKVSEQYSKAYPTDKTKKADTTVQAYQQSAICWQKLDPAKFSQDNAAYQLTYGMAKVQNLPKAPPGSSISKVGIGTFFAIIIQLVYLVAFGTLFIALVIRVSILWLFVAFSPFIVLAMFLKTANLPTPGEDKFGWKAFVKWAFAPTKVAAVWSVGFIMIAVGQTSTNQVLANLNRQGEVVSQVFSIQSLFMGMETMQELIWLIMTVGIIWLGTFWALNGLEIVDSITEPIKRTGNSLFNYVATSPKWAPIIPMLDPKTGQMTRTSLEKSQFNVLGRLRHYRSNVGQLNNYDKGSNALRDERNANQVHKIKTGNETDAYNALRSVSNLSHKELSNKKQVENMLKGSGKFNTDEAQKIADMVSKRALKPPATVTPPTTTNSAATDPKVIAAATASGVEKALRKQGLDGARLTQAMKHVNGELAKNHKLSEANLIASANKHIKEQPNSSGNNGDKKQDTDKKQEG